MTLQAEARKGLGFWGIGHRSLKTRAGDLESEFARQLGQGLGSWIFSSVPRQSFMTSSLPVFSGLGLKIEGSTIHKPLFFRSVLRGMQLHGILSRQD